MRQHPTPTRSAGTATIETAVRTVAFTVIVGALAVVFDTTIVSVALDDLAADLGASIGTIQGARPP